MRAGLAVACKLRLNKAPGTAPDTALGERVVTRCAQRSSGSKPSQKKHRKSQQHSVKRTRPTSQASQTVTPPVKVEVEAQLAKLEQAANPWWSTFCGITNGVWLGETAAFTPSTGMPCHSMHPCGFALRMPGECFKLFHHSWTNAISKAHVSHASFNALSSRLEAAHLAPAT